MDDNVPEPPIEIHRYVFIDMEFCTFLASDNSVILQEIAILDIYGQRILHHFINWQRSESELAAPRHQIGRLALMKILIAHIALCNPREAQLLFNSSGTK
jgi:hypothetical protein